MMAKKKVWWQEQLRAHIFDVEVRGRESELGMAGIF
jgi:hypothetical protein